MSACSIPLPSRWTSNAAPVARRTHICTLPRWSPQTCVEAIDANSTGRYLVATQSSQHIWDLDEMTYQHLSAKRGSGPSQAAEVLPITIVERWPAVGCTSLLWFDELVETILPIEHWRQSSTIISIEQLTPGAAEQ
jgi:hypothetical protein